jgi:tight adherence protein B
MLSGELWVICGLIFVAAFFAVHGLYGLAFRARRERRLINRRLALTRPVAGPSEDSKPLRRERGFGFLAGLPVLNGLESLIVQSGVSITPTAWLAVLIGLSFFFYALLGFWLGFGLTGLAIAIVAAGAILNLYLVWARRRRIAQFTEQLPDTLDVIVRGLRAGHPFRVALGLVAREMPDPIRTEFGILADEITFGLEQKIALDHLSRRVGQPDLSFLSIAVNIQSETGGNLAEILHRLSQLLRNRIKLRLKIRAISSEGRLSQIFLSAMPFILVLLINLLHPAYFGEAVRNHPLFVPAIVLCLALLTCGNFVMYRMVNFKF